MKMKEKGNFNSAEDLSSSELRKIRKPIIERKRRERINESLEELKVLLLQAYNRNEPQYTKMEKADILEMAVEHLQFLRASQLARMPSPYELAQKYSAGFSECLREVHRCLDTTPGVTSDLKQRVLHHLGGQLSSMNACSNILAAHNYQTHTAPASGAAGHMLLASNQNILAGGASQIPAICQQQVSPPVNRTVIHVPKPIKLEPPPFGQYLSMASTVRRRASTESSHFSTCHIGDLKTIETIRPNVDTAETTPENSPDDVPGTSKVTKVRTEGKEGESTSKTGLLTASRKLKFQQSVGAGVSVNNEVNNNNNNNNNNNRAVGEGKQDDSGVGSGFEVEDISEDEDDMWRPW